LLTQHPRRQKLLPQTTEAETEAPAAEETTAPAETEAPAEETEAPEETVETPAETTKEEAPQTFRCRYRISSCSSRFAIGYALSKKRK